MAWTRATRGDGPPCPIGPSSIIIALLSGLLITLLALASLDAEGAPRPPPNGNWVIGVGEDIEIDNETLDLRGDLDVRGSLTLDYCTLWVWSPPGSRRVLTVHPGATLREENTSIAAVALDGPFALRAEAGSTLDMFGGGVYGAGTTISGGGRDSGVYVATDALLTGVIFDHCHVGLWVQDACVTANGCQFIDCQTGAVATGVGRLDLLEVYMRGCRVGALTNHTVLYAYNCLLSSCDEGLVSYAGTLLVDWCHFGRFSKLGVGCYAATAKLERCTFRHSDGEAVMVHNSDIEIQGGEFENCTVDVRAVHSQVTINGSRHWDTFDEAITLYRSTFDVANVSTWGSYWGLRAFRSSGSCYNLTTVNATYALDLERCDSVVVEGLSVDGGFSVPNRTFPRGMRVESSFVRVSNGTIVDTRNGLSLSSTSGTLEDIEIVNCSREGVFVDLSTELTLRHVNVTNATDGFRLNLYSDPHLVECHAHMCRATGFNFTAGTRGLLEGCNASANPLGVRSHLSSPTLRFCVIYQCDEGGRSLNRTLGMYSVLSAPVFEGGAVVGGWMGLWLNLSRSQVRNVTFLRSELYCIQVRSSASDVIEGCSFLGAETATAIVTLHASPAIDANLIRGMNYGIVVYEGSDAVIRDNRIETVRYDGIQVLNNARAYLSGNVVTGATWYSLHVGILSHVTSRDDVFTSSDDYNVYVHTGSSLDIQGATISNSTVGIYSYDSPWLHVSSCYLEDNNRGIFVTASSRADPYAPRVEALVEGSYFTNHSSHSIGVSGGFLKVRDCNFLDNIAGIEAFNSTVAIEDCSLVGCWFYGLMTHNSQATWSVTNRCVLINSDIIGHVGFDVQGGLFKVEDSKFELSHGSGLVASDGAHIRMHGAKWTSPGCPFEVTNGTVQLLGARFEGTGPTGGTELGRLGVVLTSCDVELANVTFEEAGGGLSLKGSNASLDHCRFIKCSLVGLYTEGSHVSLSSCRVEGAVLGTGMRLVSSAIDAHNTTVVFARTTVSLDGGEATLSNCSIGGAEINSVEAGGGRMVLYNTTHEQDKVLVRSGGEVLTWWFVSAWVIWANQSELPLARVWVENVTGSAVVEGIPDTRGFVRLLPVLALREGALVREDFGPHVVKAELHGYGTQVSVVLEGSITVDLLLEDVEAPSILVGSPTAPETWTRNGTVEVYGKALDEGSGTSNVEAVLDYGTATWHGEGDTFQFSIQMTDGRHVVELKAVDRIGNFDTLTLVVWVETRPLVLTPPEPRDGTVTNATSIAVRGRISRTEDVLVKVNGAIAALDGETKAYSFEVGLVEGTNDIKVMAEDVYGHVAWSNLTVHTDWTPPSLVVTSPADVNTTKGWVEIEGVVDQDAILTIQGTPVLVPEGGAFTVRCAVNLGESIVTVKAMDRVGNGVEVTVYVSRTLPDGEPSGPDYWEVLPFVMAIPILVAGEWYYLRGRRRLGGGPE